MHTIGIIGGSGYTGVELLRLLLPRSDVQVKSVSSRSNAGTRLDQLFPSLRGSTDLAFSEPDFDALAECDLVFFATPNGTAMQQTAQLLDRGVKVIDLAADFRLTDLEVWGEWYGMTHACPELVAEAVYGLPELNREAIRSAQLVANPGCYPTAVQLGFLPLLEQDLVDTSSLIADCKSGISGAGRGASVPNLLAEASDSFKAYGTSGHRHLPEIEQGLSRMTGKAVQLTFSPHLLPIIRGIHATLYARLSSDCPLEHIQSVYESRFANEPFVDVMPAGSHPETRSVKGSNMCRIAVHLPQSGKSAARNTVVVHSVEDNLVKGAAGQAIQNMNLMLGLDEKTGLLQSALLP